MRDPRTILAESRTIAVVGCSNNAAKAAHAIPRALQGTGYRVIPVNPHADQVLGERSYPTLDDVPGEIDLVDVFRPAREAPDVVRAAVRVGAKAVWLQSGIVSDEARRIAEDAGIDYVENMCTGVEVSRHGLGPPPA